MSVYVPTERERECRRLLEDAREAVERLEKIAGLAEEEARRHWFGRCEMRDRLFNGATETLRRLRGKIEDAEALVRRWGE